MRAMTLDTLNSNRSLIPCFLHSVQGVQGEKGIRGNSSARLDQRKCPPKTLGAFWGAHPAHLVYPYKHYINPGYSVSPVQGGTLNRPASKPRSRAVLRCTIIPGDVQASVGQEVGSRPV